MVSPNAKEPPHSTEAEQSLLGAVLLDPDVLHDVADIVEPQDFYETRHAAVFKTALELSQAGTRPDATTLLDKLKQEKRLSAIGGEGYLASLAALVPSTTGSQDYARIVREHSVRRQVITAAMELQSTAYGGANVGELLKQCDEKILNIDAKAGDGESRTIQDFVKLALRDVEAAHRNEASLNGVSLPLRALDEATGGMMGGQLIIAAGRPGMGKTAFAMNIADHVGAVEHKAVLFCTLEVPGESLIKNMLARRAGVNASKIHARSKVMDEVEMSNVEEAAKDIGQLPIHVDDDPNLSPISLRAKATRLKSRVGELGLIVVDYLQLMDGPNAENRQLQLTMISRELKKLAKTLDVPILALAQLNREVESRHDKRPRLSDLRESGAIEQDADVVMMLYRPGYYEPEGERSTLCEVNIVKQRNGPTKRVEVAFLAEHLQFANLAHGEYVSDPGQPGPGMDGFEDETEPQKPMRRYAKPGKDIYQ